MEVLSLSYRRGGVAFPKKEDGTIVYDDIDYKLTWAALECLVEKGLVKAIGLSNFNSRQIDDILSVAKIKPAVLQVGEYGGVLCVVTCKHNLHRDRVITYHMITYHGAF